MLHLCLLGKECCLLSIAHVAVVSHNVCSRHSAALLNSIAIISFVVLDNGVAVFCSGEAHVLVAMQPYCNGAAVRLFHADLSLVCRYSHCCEDAHKESQ